ncbi:hypothetical protein L6452_38326 [Arctium lappa]|uniref:Uncharacterized protein n=1 Tax=Arctium lappa TaxID=4217 RepID=A0ACB8Y9P5_ARCLA|nr:hypothetical protein L6452_38326 [Arctium lappa]
MDNFRKPKPTTRVGVENQAKIPRLMEKHEPSELTCYDLPIPVTWVRSNQPKTSNENAIESNDARESATVDGELIPLPGLWIEPWSAIEHGSFLLGIYVFPKNFRLVKRLIGSKRMRSVISYYYRDFHKSGAHDIWSKWRNDTLKRPCYARKLFTGWNHQELISRLSSNVTDECKDRLIKDGTKYIEGRLSLTRFVFALKENVGMNLLIEAVAIGQEDRDLLEFRPISDWFYVNIEVPIGNACSSHTPQEILKILKGDVRLSKARSSDLFWNAVWPRLLARGWHCVQPRNNGLQNSKNLVFLVPGVVAELSRNELTKGVHYFDSLTDVLSKVASEPELLELESNPDEPVGSDANQDPQDYVETNVPQSDRDLKLFTIVDISSDRDRDGVIKSIELPSLPVSEPIYIVEQGPDRDEQDLNEFCNNNNNSVNHLDLKRSECYNEPKRVDDTDENIGFQVKTPSGNGENEETVEEPCSNRKLDQGVVIDPNLFQMAPDSDSDQSSLSVKPAANPLEFSNAGAVILQQPVSVPQRQSTRSRMLSTKALEALAFGWVRGKTATVSSGGAGNVDNAMDGPFSGSMARLSNVVIPCQCF